jgi:hypothetical protein
MLALAVQRMRCHSDNRNIAGLRLVLEASHGFPAVHDQLDFRDLLHRQVGGLLALENATRVKSDLSVILDQARSVTYEPARNYELRKSVHGRNRMTCRECNELLNPAVKKRITADEQRAGSRLNHAHEGSVDFAVGARF